MNSLLKYYFLILCLPLNILAQENKQVRDSDIMLRDSVVYESIDQISQDSQQDSVKYTTVAKFSGRSKTARFIYRTLFRPLGNEAKPELSESEIEEASYHRRAQGKIIRSINIQTLDPFGYSIRDTNRAPGNVLIQTGNFLHPKTKSTVIKNLLLFRQNQKYDSVLVKESVRLIRLRDYIRDVYLVTGRVSNDSVDVNIRAMDVWSLIPSAGVSGSAAAFRVKDLNFAGSGHLLDASTLWKRPEGTNITRVRYFMPNIKNTYTSLNLQYFFSPNSNILKTGDFDNFFYSPVSYNPQYLFSVNENILRSIEINRPFYSPVAKWAGGVFLGQMITTQSYMLLDSIRFGSQKTNIQDYWIGRSWQLNLGTSNNERITSLVVAGRLIRTIYPSRSLESGEAGIFRNQAYYFGSVNLTSRKYFRDRYIFNYGKTEDVPGGRSAGITIGKEYQQHNRFYVGLNTSMGTFYRFGYLGAQLSYGTFRGPEGFQQGMISGRLTYFTRLLSIGNWSIRQFVRPSFIFGIHRLPADNQPLRIGIKGFEAIESHASNIVVVSLQTQSYAPWNLAGFHFGPYFFSHLGIIGREPLSDVRKRNIYSLMGLGILIKNDYLMFRTFQVSLSFYPYIPSSGYNIFRANAYKTTDYGFRDFEVLKPGIIE